MLKQAISGVKWTCIAILFIAIKAHALTASEVMAISVGESDARVEALNKSLAQADEKTHAFIQALSDDAVKLADGKVFIIKDAKAFDPVTGTELPLPNIFEDIVNNNRMAIPTHCHILQGIQMHFNARQLGIEQGAVLPIGDIEITAQ